MEPITKEIFEWLYKRGITDDVIVHSKLSCNGDELVIPIFDEHGDFLFNKYRRNPASVEGPKYRYEKGSTTALFNLHTLQYVQNNEPVFICEGELDCLLLNSKGQHAVTSTGGCGTFKKEWASHFENKNVFIVFDNDDAGYKGAMKAQGIIPHAQIVFLPEDTNGNDITDYFQDHTLQDFFSLKARSYPIPREPSGMPTEKKIMRSIVKSFGDAADQLLEIKREFTQERKNVKPILIMLQYVTSRYETYSHALKSFDRKFPKGDGDNASVRRAKEVPITQFIKFNYNGFAKCISHNEHTPSMRYNKPDSKYPNTIKCFSCGMMMDSIDVYMHLNNVEFNEAVKRLNEMI
jgi:DNA primase